MAQSIARIVLEGTRGDIYGETRIGSITPDDPWAREPTVALREHADATVLALADGNGSWEDGREGSRRAVALLADAVGSVRDERAMIDAFAVAWREHGRWNEERGATSYFGRAVPDAACSVVVCVILRSEILVAWLGAAAARIVRGGEVIQASVPDTLGARFVAAGKLPQEELATFEHADVILSIFGTDGPITPPQVRSWPRAPGAFLLLAVERVYGNGAAVGAPAARELVETLLSSCAPDPEAAAIAARL